jgi:hypothetical protein
MKVPRSVILLISADLLIIAELFIAMYFAHANEQRFTFVFLGVFFSLMIPTVFAYFLLRGRNGSPE